MFDDTGMYILNMQSSGGECICPNATTEIKGIVELAESGEFASNVVVQGNDLRLPTENEKNALEGTLGLPSNINKYVTKLDFDVIDCGTL